MSIWRSSKNMECNMTSAICGDPHPARGLRNECGAATTVEILSREATPEISQPQGGWNARPFGVFVPEGRWNGAACQTVDVFHRPSGTGGRFLPTFQPPCGWYARSIESVLKGRWIRSFRLDAVHSHRPSGTGFDILLLFQPLRGWLISCVASRLRMVLPSSILHLPSSR